jgi:hypothetical protein
MKEYIVAVEDDVIAYEEYSVGYIRRQKKLIRCEECKYYQHDGNAGEWLWCMMNHHYTDEEKYCAWAERKESEKCS